MALTSVQEKMSIILKLAIMCVREKEMVLNVNWSVLLHNVHLKCFRRTWPGLCVRGLLSRFLDANAFAFSRTFAVLTRRLQDGAH
jgi:hypothetical protein